MLGINPATWKIIDELHRNTRACVKWNDCISDEINAAFVGEVFSVNPLFRTD
jgi:hypothetical protein